MFEIHLGVPEMEELWKSLQKRHQDGTATKEEEKLRRRMGKAITVLETKCCPELNIWLIPNQVHVRSSSRAIPSCSNAHHSRMTFTT